MKKTQAALLGESQRAHTHLLTIKLQQQHSIEMRFSDGTLAQEMRDHFRALGALGSLGIRDIQLEQL